MSLEKKLDNLYSKTIKKTYKVKKTKTQARIELLELKQAYQEKMRWKILPKAVLKSMAMYGFKSAKDLF